MLIESNGLNQRFVISVIDYIVILYNYHATEVVHPPKNTKISQYTSGVVVALFTTAELQTSTILYLSKLTINFSFRFKLR